MGRYAYFAGFMYPIGTIAIGYMAIEHHPIGYPRRVHAMTASNLITFSLCAAVSRLRQCEACLGSWPIVASFLGVPADGPFGCRRVH